MPLKTKHKLFSAPVLTEAQSYWLGFFCADGGFHTKLKQLTVHLSRRDRDHLAKLAASLSVSIKDGETFDERTQKTYYWSRIHFHGKATISEMIEMGIPHNKSKELGEKIFSYIPENLLHHFVRGYFDGDGCISKIGIAEYRIEIVGTHKFLDALSRSVNELVFEVRMSAPHKSGSIYGIGLCGTDRINAFKNWMYKDASIFLERKKEIFERVPEHRGASKHKGVYRRGNSWVARVYENKKMRTLKQCKTEDEAARILEEYHASVPNIISQFVGVEDTTGVESEE